MNEAYRICAFADEAGDAPEEQIAAMRENGVSLLELRSVWGKNVISLSNDEAARFTAQLKDAGISVWSIGSPCGKDQIGDPFAPQLDRLKRALELAQITGAQRIRLFSFYGCEEASAAVRDEVMLRLTRFCEAAQGSGVTLCHENEKGIYGDTAARCLDIHRSVPALGGIFDPANFLQCGEDTLAAWDLLNGYIDYLHVKDVKSDGVLVPAGQGQGNLPEIINRFLEQGGSVMTLEPHLKVFTALSSLENGGEVSAVDDTQYPTARAAFTAAAQGLHNILKNR